MRQSSLAPIVRRKGVLEQARIAQIWLTWVFVIGLTVELFFAGAASFGATDDWDLHSIFGYVIGVGALALLILSAVARRLLALAALLVVLLVLQIVLAAVGEDVEWLGALHAVNALAIFAVALMAALRAQRVRIADGGEAAAGPEPRA